MSAKNHFLIADTDQLIHPTDIFHGKETKLGYFGPSSTDLDLFCSRKKLEFQNLVSDLGSIILTGFATDANTSKSVHSALMAKEEGHPSASVHLADLINDSSLLSEDDFEESVVGIEVSVKQLILSGAARDGVGDISGEKHISLPTVLTPRFLQAMKAEKITNS